MYENKLTRLNWSMGKVEHLPRERDCKVPAAIVRRNSWQEREVDGTQATFTEVVSN